MLAKLVQLSQAAPGVSSLQKLPGEQPGQGQPEGPPDGGDGPGKTFDHEQLCF